MHPGIRVLRNRLRGQFVKRRELLSVPSGHVSACVFCPAVPLVQPRFVWLLWWRDGRRWHLLSGTVLPRRMQCLSMVSSPGTSEHMVFPLGQLGRMQLDSVPQPCCAVRPEATARVGLGFPLSAHRGSMAHQSRSRRARAQARALAAPPAQPKPSRALRAPLRLGLKRPPSLKAVLAPELGLALARRLQRSPLPAH